MRRAAVKQRQGAGEVFVCGRCPRAIRGRLFRCACRKWKLLDELADFFFFGSDSLFHCDAGDFGLGRPIRSWLARISCLLPGSSRVDRHIISLSYFVFVAPLGEHSAGTPFSSGAVSPVVCIAFWLAGGWHFGNHRCRFCPFGVRRTGAVRLPARPPSTTCCGSNCSCCPLRCPSWFSRPLSRGMTRTNRSFAKVKDASGWWPTPLLCLIWMSGTDKTLQFFQQGLAEVYRSIDARRVGRPDGFRVSIPTTCSGVSQVYTASFDARVDFEMEYRLRRFDGEYRWIRGLWRAQV